MMPINRTVVSLTAGLFLLGGCSQPAAPTTGPSANPGISQGATTPITAEVSTSVQLVDEISDAVKSIKTIRYATTDQWDSKKSTATGEIDLADPKYPAFHQVGESDSEIIRIKDVLYYKPPKGTWQKLTTKAQMTAGPFDGLSKMKKKLGELKDLGTEVVGGQEAHRYQMVVPTAAGKAVGMAWSGTYEVWVNDEFQVLKASMAGKVDKSEQYIGGKKYRWTFTVTAFDEPVSIKAPKVGKK